jgi:hypothetical protein
MAEVVNSLFGITPESLQADRDAALQAQALQYAKLDPFQRATAAIYSGANRLGGAVGGMLGAQDPEMMRIRQRQQLLEGADISDPKVLRERATIAMQQNDYPAAQQLASRAMDIEAKQASIAKDVATANREKVATTPADIAKAQRVAAIKAALPAYKAAGDETTYKLLEDELKALEPAEKTPSFGTDREAVAAELYENKTFAQLTPAQKAVVNKRVEQETKKGTTVNVSVAGQKAFSEKMGELDAKRVAEAGVARDNAFATIRSLDQLAKLDDQGLISGSFATGRVGVTNLLNTLGLASPADQQRLATSQNYQKVSGDVILGVLGGKLGAGFSNEDRKFIEGLVPQLETSPAARRQLITFMRDKNIAIAEEATRLENYAREKDGLKGFQPKIPFGQNAPVSSMSADDLAKAAGGKIVNGKFVPNK